MRLLALTAISGLVIATPALAGHKAYAPINSNLSCPGDCKVWVNTRTSIYHLEGERWDGRTTQGHFVWEKAAKAQSNRETENGQ